MDDNDSIRTDEIKRFSEVLDAMSRAYSSLAVWLHSKNINEIPGGGTETAKRGLRYLGGFTGTVLKAYSKSLLGDDEDGPPEIANDLLKAETATKAASKSRSGITPESAHAKHQDGPASKRTRKPKAKD